MKRLGVNAIGLAASETSSLSAFLDLLALDDGHVFALDATSDATIVFVNPTSSEGAKLLAKPSAGVCLISYGIHDHHHPELRWTLATPLRLPQLREILLDIVDKQRETRRMQVPNMATVENERHRSQVATTLGCTGTHEKLENLLRIICRITKGRVVHEICGIPGVEITVFPDLGKASVRADGVWTSAVLAGTRNLTVIPHMGAQIGRAHV